MARSDRTATPKDNFCAPMLSDPVHMHREVLWDWRHRSYQQATISVANARGPKHQMCASRTTMSKPMRCQDGNRWQCVNWTTGTLIFWSQWDNNKTTNNFAEWSVVQQMHADKSRDIEATPIMLNPLDMSIQNPTQCRAITMIRHAWLKNKNSRHTIPPLSAYSKSRRNAMNEKKQRPAKYQWQPKDRKWKIFVCRATQSLACSGAETQME